MKDKNLPVIKLIGDEQENFYQLGLKDREDYFALLEQSKALIKTPWGPINKAFEEVAKPLVKKLWKEHKEFHERIHSYSEGLNCPPDEIILSMLIPELMSCFPRWQPAIPPKLFGCSSYFCINEKNNILHGRILDFPMMGSFDTNERFIQQRAGDKVITSLGSAGFPYPSISACNSDGVTLCLHQKFTDVFDRKGRPIFDLVYDLLKYCSTEEDIKSFLSEQRSITTWSLYMSLPTNKALEVEISSNKLQFKAHQIEKNKTLYLCNCIQDEEVNQLDFQPFQFNLYNSERQEIAKKKIKRLEKKEINSLALLREISSPISAAQNKEMLNDPLTPSTLQSIVFDMQEEEIHTIVGEAPKVFLDNVAVIKDIFHEAQPIYKKLKVKPYNQKYYDGCKLLMQSQMDLEKEDIHSSYHNIQMAIDYLKDTPKYIESSFFFLVYQVLHEEHRRQREQLLFKFKQIQPKLPHRLVDHCILFIHKLERELNNKLTTNIDQIENESLKKVYKMDEKIKLGVIRSFTYKLTFPRVDISDVIYAYVK
tara:strand:- start:352238 stop:353848 length:1611 start_codon:yes stop_codon:yes gene_type:complete